MNALDLSWAAGVFEGEGTVRIAKATSNTLGHLCVSMVSTDTEMVEPFQEWWPGQLRPATGLDPLRQRPAWVWLRNSRKAAAFLRDVGPFIRTRRVKRKIELALEFQDQKSCSRTVRGEPEEYRSVQFGFYLQMRDLNARGVQI